MANRARIFKWSLPLFTILLSGAVGWALYRVLHHYHLHDIFQAFRNISAGNLLLAFALSLLGYCVLSGYDFLALQYIQRPLPFRKILLASFISYAFANNTGTFAIIASSSVRYRLYGSWGLSGVEIGKVVVFCSVSFWLGFLLLASGLFLFIPISALAVLPAPVLAVRVAGIILIAIMFAYWLLTFSKKNQISVRNWTFALPSPWLVPSQFILSVLDLLIFAAALYILLPASPDLHIIVFLSMVLTAMVAGLISNIPGGLGVFETVMILSLSSYMDKVAVAGALMAFRVIYYFLPLLMAAAILVIYEVLQKKETLGRLAGAIGQVTSWLVPHVLALLIFFGGALLLFSGATPAIASRLDWVIDIIPLPVLELSHFLGSLAGAALLVLATGLRKRLDAAYYLSAILLCLGILFSLFKGGDFEEALGLLFFLALLVPCRRQFYRKTSFLAEPLSLGWSSAIAIVVLASIWLGNFSYKHIGYSNELWWQFALSGDAPRFLRATVGVIIAALLFAIMKLMRPAEAKPTLPTSDDFNRALPVIRQSRTTTPWLALAGDKELLFSQSGNAFIMYGIEGQSWVAMGDPVGDETEIPDLLWRFKGLCDRYDARPIFYEVKQKNLHLYLDLGLMPLKIGEEGRVALRDFTLDGGDKKAFRHIRNQINKKCTFDLLSPEKVSAILPDLRRVSDSWLTAKNSHEKGFSLGFFKDDYVRHFPVAVVRRNNEVLAFANLFPGAEKNELSVDLMRYLPDAPHGIMDFLFLEIMLLGKAQGYQWFNLGMAPLSGLEDRAMAPLWNKIGSFIYRHGEHFYNFQGLRFYKNKFSPVWEPRYLVSPGGFALPKILTDIATLISGGGKNLFAK